MTEEKWLQIYSDIEDLIKKAMREAGKNEDELPVLMSEVKNILFS